MATQNGINVTFSVTVVSISDFNIVSEHSTNRGNGQKIEISSAFSTLLCRYSNTDFSSTFAWRKRSIPTHLERHNPPTIIAKMGLKRA